MTPPTPPPADLGARFAIDGTRVDVAPLGLGHIHRTWLATYRTAGGGVSRHVHQRLNTSVFPDLGTLMGNFTRVTAHLGATADADGGPDPHRRALRLEPAADGSPTAVDADGAVWRTLAFVDGASAPPRFPGPEQAASAAAVAARFVADLAGLPGPPLAEVLPGFHDVGRRLADLGRAAAADVAGRAAGCGSELGAILAAAPLVAEVAAARLPARTVHNDAKAGNVLFDDLTGRALCMVDLDTVGPGAVVVDVGDLVRSGAATAPEDAATGDVDVRGDVVDAVIEAYTTAGAGFLTGHERAHLGLAGPLMALEAAARFLTDHLAGDVYFRVDEPGHNLVRARNQIRMLELLCAQAGRRRP
jgi:hypothetical protein